MTRPAFILAVALLAAGAVYAAEPAATAATDAAMRRDTDAGTRPDTNAAVRRDTDAAARADTDAAPRPPSQAAPVATPAAPAKTPTWERYQVVAQRNMFLRERSRPRRSEGTSSYAPPPRAERNFVLTGIIRQGDDYIAFFEDQRAGTTQRLKQNDAIASGKITAMTLDSVTYAVGDQQSQVRPGQSLDGGAPSGPAPTPAGTLASPASPAAAAPAAAGPPPSQDVRAILERLRQRREQEMKK